MPRASAELHIRGFSRIRYSIEDIELELLKPVLNEKVVKEVDTDNLESSLESIALSLLGTRPEVDVAEVELRVDSTHYVYSTSRFISRELQPVLIAPRPSRVRSIYVAKPGEDGVSIDLGSQAPHVPNDELYVYETPISVKGEAMDRVLVVESDSGTFIVDLNALPSPAKPRRTRSSQRKRKRRRKKKSKRKRSTASSK